MKKILFLILLCMVSCKTPIKVTSSKPITADNSIPTWKPYDESAELAENQDHKNPRMRYKLIQSRFLNKNKIWKVVAPQIADFSEEEYQRLKPFILEQDIYTIQGHIRSRKLSYKKLTQWYLWRIVKFENDPDKTLHSIININPRAVTLAAKCDLNYSSKHHAIFGMPVLLKDNIGTSKMPTTAGAVALRDNQTNNAFIVNRLEAKGAIILGKVNLSEWAYYFCGGCPLGYSAIGGQTLNPYGRRIFETGGSSSGSGTTMAANYAVAAVGTETSGSILSPSSANSIVGLKPTMGLLSRSGIVPISSTLDTPGPMTRNVTDNAILLDAMTGYDTNDPASQSNSGEDSYQLGFIALEGPRIGVFEDYLERDSLYRSNVKILEDSGFEVVKIDPEKPQLNGFLSLLNIDMKHDLPVYLSKYASSTVTVKNVKDIVSFNLQDTGLYAPYGQARLLGILDDTTSLDQLPEIKENLETVGKDCFDPYFDQYDLDAVLSINNNHASQAAVAKYPALTVPMGYRKDGQPAGLTFIGQPFTEELLLKIAYTFEQASQARKIPVGYE